MTIADDIVNKLPYSSTSVRQQADRLFSRKVLGSVLVGKFIGDYAALTVVRYLGTDVGYISGIIFSILVFLYWERIERAYQKKSNEISNKQTNLEEF